MEGSRPLRVFHLDTARRPGGGQIQIALLLRELVKRHVVCTLICPVKSPLTHVELNGVEMFHLPMRGEWDLWSVIRLRRLIRSYRPDILHAHDARAHTLSLLTRTKDQRIVVHRRVAFPISTHLLTRWKYGKGVDHFVAVSQKSKDQLQRSGVPESKITVVNSALDDSRFTDELEDQDFVRKELGLEGGCVIIGTVGRLTREKRHAWLLETLAPLLRERPSVRVVLIGDGPEKPRLVQRAERLGILDKAVFAGHREDVTKLLSAFDLFVLSSDLEGYPMSVAEAMAAGCPVVCTDSGGVREIVTSENEGILVPVEDSEKFRNTVRDLLDNADKRRSLGESGRESVRKKWGVKVMADSVLNLYTRLLIALD